MPIRFKCSTCNSEIAVDDRFAGKRGKCVKCGEVLHIPHPKAAVTEAGVPCPVRARGELEPEPETKPPVSAMICPKCGFRKTWEYMVNCWECRECGTKFVYEPPPPLVEDSREEAQTDTGSLDVGGIRRDLQTISGVGSRLQEGTCPRCGSAWVNKTGSKGEYDQYTCKNCGLVTQKYNPSTLIFALVVFILIAALCGGIGK